MRYGFGHGEIEGSAHRRPCALRAGTPGAGGQASSGGADMPVIPRRGKTPVDAEARDARTPEATERASGAPQEAAGRPPRRRARGAVALLPDIGLRAGPVVMLVGL